MSLVCGNFGDISDHAVQPFTEKCVTRFWEKLCKPPADYKTNWNDLVSYRIFYTLPGKSSHAALIFSDDGINGFSIELIIKRTPEWRLCLKSKWRKRNEYWTPVPKFEINTSRYRLYQYAITFMKQFGTHWDKMNHSCQDFILRFLWTLGIPRPFRTTVGKWKLVGKFVTLSVTQVAILCGIEYGLEYLEKNNLGLPAEVRRQIGEMCGMIAKESWMTLLAGETAEELEANRKDMSAFGIDVVAL